MFGITDNDGAARRRSARPGLRLVAALTLAVTLILPAQPASFAAVSAGKDNPPAPGRAAGGNHPGWYLVDSPNAVPDDANVLSGVTVVSSDDAWAVGWYYTGQMAIGHTLIEHWNGREWSIVPSPNVGEDGSFLFNVSGVAANDVWAAGAYCSAGPCTPLLPNEAREALLLHWDGTAWSVVPLPDTGGAGSTLQAVAAISRNDVWAAGMLGTPSGAATRILHWDGTRWSSVAHPRLGPNDITFNMTARTADDIWIVGMECNETFSSCVPRTEHYNGHAWSNVPIPAPGTIHGKLWSVSARSAKDAWAVGLYFNGETWRPIIEHWNGSVWTLLPDPVPELPLAYVLGVVAVSPNDAWAAGLYLRDDGTIGNLMLRWDGRSWQRYEMSSPGLAGNEIEGLAMVKHNEFWAVGLTADAEYGGPGMRTQIQHFTIH